jgi:hypothetical protein
MSRYFTQWDDAAVGAGVPTGWTRRWQAAVNPGNAVIAPAYKRLVVKRRAVSYKEVATNFPAAITYDALDADANRANIEILTAVKVDQTTPAADFCIWTRGSGTTSGTENAYRAQLSFPTSSAPNQVFLVKVIAGAATVITSAAFTFDSTKTYWARFRVNGTTLSLFVWAEGTDEPTTPTLTASDAAVAAAGFTGFQWTRPALANQIGYVNFFSVATNGDTAVKPRTDVEFNAWLDNQTADRRVLAEMSATGYDSSGSPFTKTVNVYVATGGYTSQAWDSPANRHYDAWITGVPNFRRQMSTALAGNATAGFGSLIVANPAATSSGPGVRDDWLRMKWKRNFLRLYMGDVSWPKHDFRLILMGRVGRPKESGSKAQIEFPITDLLDMLDQPLQTSRYNSTAAVPNSLKPILSGLAFWMEPVPTTVGGLELQWHDGAIFADPDVYDNGLSLTASRAATAVDTVTETLTCANHGGTVDSRVMWPSVPPGGLTALVDYYIIAAGLTSSTFRVSATRGGAAMNLTGGFGGTFSLKTWWNDLANGKSTLTVSPAGRIMGRFVQRGASYNLGDVLDYLMTTRYAMAADYKDGDSFTAINTVAGGIVFYDEKVTGLQALDRFCRGTNSWYGFTPDGLLQVGRIDLPAATSVLDLTVSDVKNLKLESVLPAININTLAVQYAKRFFRSGPFNLPPSIAGNGVELLTPYSTNVPSTTWGAAGTPLDSHPDQADVSDYPTLDSYFPNELTSGEADRMKTLFQRPLGIFSFQTRFSAIRDTVTIGSTIQLTHPRKGWKVWSGVDPASPDNAATIDSTKAVVLGIDVNFGSKSAMPVTLKVFRPLPGYYPTADLN